VQLVDVVAELHALTLGVVPVCQRWALVSDDELCGALGHSGRFHGFRERVAHSFTLRPPSTSFGFATRLCRAIGETKT
jgi:hypothetical protein